MKHLKPSEKQNATVIGEFILLGFGNTKNLNTLLFVLFLIIYILTVSGNILIITLVVAEKRLHTPMYFFISNLSFLEICYSTTILPKMMASFLTRNKTISLWGCILQMHIFCTLAATECYLLAAMSYDRYLAICRPLHYVTLMNFKTCVLLVSISWITGFMLISVLTPLLTQLTFCNQYKIDHFFCDFTPLIRLSCSDTWVIESVALITSTLGIIPTFFITVTSYAFIIQTIMKIQSENGRQKAFSICTSHLTVVSIFYGSLMLVYIMPTIDRFKDMNKSLSFLYSVLTPMGSVKDWLGQLSPGRLCSNPDSATAASSVSEQQQVKCHFSMLISNPAAKQG
ncbi:PREDICTED: olfactory receptor 6F1-like [Thamnophis sirtalis]|uniref:Olfactory receptor n=1 Tax=Thamnophis sirtalis TaxID=35019 RepID=A0A6I9WYX7_9SAUR|nr:PREDICTED: olfactory receptor 6F1-like [Thamnophis sirtalis]